MRSVSGRARQRKARLELGALALVATSAACGGATTPATSADANTRFTAGDMRVAAEGLCSRLSIHAIGDRRVLVFGDTGYDLAGWLPGDELPAAQSIAVLTPEGAGLDPRFLRGLPRDDRGYVPGHLLLGGSDDANAWLLRVTTRYSPGGVGSLFARESFGHRLGPRGWVTATGSPVDRPAETARLPALPSEACGEGQTFLPLASASTKGGVLVAGRCDDPRVPNPAEARLLVAHGRPGATLWKVESVPGTSNLDGIVNVALAATSDDRATLIAFEPFVPPERRQSFAATWNGRAWAPTTIELPGGYLDVAYGSAGEILVANGRGVHRVAPSGKVTEIALPPLRFARGGAGDALYVHGVQTFGAEVWVEASYRVWPVRERPAVWASALFTNVNVPRTVHCDAREPADRALAEVDPG
jgi:hypothetical protein